MINTFLSPIWGRLRRRPHLPELVAHDLLLAGNQVFPRQAVLSAGRHPRDVLGLYHGIATGTPDGPDPARDVKHVVPDLPSLRGSPAHEPDAAGGVRRGGVVGSVLAGVTGPSRGGRGTHVGVAGKGQSAGFCPAPVAAPHHHRVRSVQGQDGDREGIPGVLDAPAGVALRDLPLAGDAGRSARGSGPGHDGIGVDPPLGGIRPLGRSAAAVAAAVIGFLLAGADGGFHLDRFLRRRRFFVRCGGRLCFSSHLVVVATSNGVSK